MRGLINIYRKTLDNFGFGFKESNKHASLFVLNLLIILGRYALEGTSSGQESQFYDSQTGRICRFACLAILLFSRVHDLFRFTIDFRMGFDYSSNEK